MAVNADKTGKWKDDVRLSVDFYNSWFIEFAPKTYRDTRGITTKQVVKALEWTSNLNSIAPEVLKAHPNVLPMLRMSTAPPIARDRLIGLANVSQNLVLSMEQDNRVPPKMSKTALDEQLLRIGQTILKLADHDLFVWLETRNKPSEIERHRAATIVADRLCGSVSNPIIRNAQERRQLGAIRQWLENRGYTYVQNSQADTIIPGTFSFRLNMPVRQPDGRHVNIPIDTVIQPLKAKTGDLPLLVEAKSAGDFTNTNKRRKEEAQKVAQLRATYGDVRFILFLCGYFDSGYLGYEAAEGIDWVWEHRIDDLALFGL